MEKLEKWRGHLYNWYDTITMKKLRRYISSVDSGNLVGYMMVLKEGLKEYRTGRLIRPAFVPGLSDTMECWKMTARIDKSSRRKWSA